MGVDRTAEFKQYVQQQGGSVSSTAQAQRPQSQLHMYSLALGTKINDAQVKINDLKQRTRLTRQKFDADNQAVDRLINAVQVDVKDINEKLESLDANYLSMIDSSSQQAIASAKNIVESLKMRHMQLIREFQQVCTLRTKAVQNMHNRNQYMFSGGMTGGDVVGAGDTEGLLGAGGAQAQSVLHAGNDRMEAMQSINKVIGELGQMFQKMTEMVKEQELQVMRIDENVDDTLGNLQQGNTELEKYWNNLSQNRQFMIKVFAVVLAFVIFFMFCLR